MNEDNYGNHGTIKAVYDTNAANDVKTFPIQLSWSTNVGLECYHCQTALNATLADRDPCYNSPTELYACPDINSTTCVAQVSNYQAHVGRDYLEQYQYAWRGCSTKNSDFAEPKSNPVISWGYVYFIYFINVNL